MPMNIVIETTKKSFLSLFTRATLAFLWKIQQTNIFLHKKKKKKQPCDSLLSTGQLPPKKETIFKSL